MSALRAGFGGLLVGCVAALVVSPSLASAETCPNEAFRVGLSAGLPDCRAYEQVTPVYKNGGGVYLQRVGHNEDGSLNVVTNSFAAFAGIEDDNYIPGGFYASVRTEAGWSTSPLPPPASEYQTSEIDGGVEPWLASSLDGRSALWQARRTGQPDNRVDFYVTRPGGTVEDVGVLTPPETKAGLVNEITNDSGLGIDPVGESDDLSHIVYAMKPEKGFGFGFWPFDPTTGTEDIYEFIGTDNPEPMLVGVDDNGELVSRCGTSLAGYPRSEFPHGKAHNAVSADGDVIFFTANMCAGANQLFARIDNGQSDAHTVAISEPSSADCTDCNTSVGVQTAPVFVGASEDGSKAFFVTTQPLLGSDTSENLYEYDFDAPAGERVVRVSGGDSTVPSPTAEVQGVVDTSEDGSHVYFVARGVLTANPNSQGQVAQAGANNLYVFERDAEYPNGHTEFIADFDQNEFELWGETNKGEVFPQARANVTPDGRFLVFASATPHLTADDTSAAAQVFEYDAQTGILTRVSIGQDGYNDNGNTNIDPASIVLPIFHVSEPNLYWSKLSVSANGAFIFFQSSDGLTPRALNNKVVGENCFVRSQKETEELCEPPLFEEFETILEEEHFLQKYYANNIYEYHDGNVYLISDGRDISQNNNKESAVNLVGTSESGNDVLFETTDQLVPQDTDTNIDIYDARVDGGFAPPASAQACTGDGCQGPLSAAPTLLSPGSEFQAGTTPQQPPTSSVPAKKAKAKVKAKSKKKVKKAKKGKARDKGKKAAASGRRGYGKGGRS